MLTSPVACQEADHEIWRRIDEIKLNLDFTRIGGFYILDDKHCAVIRWGSDSRLCVVSLATGEILKEVVIRDAQCDTLEAKIARNLPCLILGFNKAATESTPRFSYETMFDDHGQKYIGWHLKVFLTDTTGRIREDQIAVVSRLNKQYDLFDHRILIPSAVGCEEGRLTTRFDLRSRNAIWNDMLYLQRHSDVVIEGEPVYDIQPISSDDDSIAKFSRYQIDLDNTKLWHSREDLFDLTAYYGFHFFSDGVSLLCNSGNDTRLYYFDKREFKYDLHVESFTTLWSFEKIGPHLFYTTSNHSHPRSTRTLYISDLNGMTLAKKSFVSERGADSLPYYWHAIAWNQKFYTIFRLGDEYFLQIWEAQLDK